MAAADQFPNGVNTETGFISNAHADWIGLTHAELPLQALNDTFRWINTRVV
jgi:hypothetical protein